MRTPKRTLWALLFALAVHFIATPAEAGPRGPRVRALQGVLIDLARIEVSNVEREDPNAERAVQQLIDQSRRQLLGAVNGSVPFVPALRFTRRSLRIIANYNSGYGEDAEALPRMLQQVEQLGQRVDQILSLATGWTGGGPPQGWQPPQGWGAPGWNQPPPPPPPGYPNRPPPPPGYNTPPPPPPGYNNPPPGYAQPGGVIPSDRFAQLVNQVRAATFQEAQLNVVRDALRSDYWFTCQQIVAVMNLLSFEASKVEVGALLYPRAVDPQNFSDLIGALTFESYRQQLRQRLGR